MGKLSFRLAGVALVIGLTSGTQQLMAAQPTFQSAAPATEAKTLPRTAEEKSRSQGVISTPLATSGTALTLTEPLHLKISLSQRQVTLYRGKTRVKSFWIAVGRKGWETPTGKFRVAQMLRDPAWAHPLKKGIVIPGGDPDNPLGRYWIGFWTDGKNWIGFHGTPNPQSVGTAASHGCIRMYNQDIAELFPQVTSGTPVIVER